MSDEVRRYLEEFTSKARAAGLDMREPGKNWAPMRPLARGSHISLSVARHQIQVNLNNEADADRAVIQGLESERGTIEKLVGEGLTWERKDGRKKTAVRASREEGFEDDDWDEQHRWAIRTMKRFERIFGARLMSA